MISTGTATLLFGCIAAEEEALRPRAVAALDALLAAYCRLINLDGSNLGTAAPIVETSDGTVTQADDNPWGAVSVVTDATMEDNDTTRKSHQIELCKLLLPILWNAAQHSQPKQCRVAAARWASDLLWILDLISACHILCFLAGDSDLTAASIARDALTSGKDAQNEATSEASSKAPADFSKLVGVLLTENKAIVNNSSWRQTFWQFTPQGQAVAIEYLVHCLLHDIYGGDDDATITFVSAIATSILNATSNSRREYLGLLDECAEALSLCLSTSVLARTFITSPGSPLTPSTIQELSLSCNSSKARRLLAESWGQLYLDTSLWVNDEWHTAVEASLRSCCDLIQGNASSVGNKHGAAFLGATGIKVYRRHSTLLSSESICSLVSR
jgi:proteasome component ECM29